MNNPRKITRTFRIPAHLVERFDRAAELAKVNKTDVVVKAIEDFVLKTEREKVMNEMNVYDKLYDAGYALQQKLGDQESRKLAWKLNNFILTDINGFMQELLKACLGANFTVPKELLDASRNPTLAQAFVAGLYGEGRGESE